MPKRTQPAAKPPRSPALLSTRLVTGLQRLLLVICATVVALLAAELVFRVSQWGQVTLSGMPPASEARRDHHPVIHHRYKADRTFVADGPDFRATYSTNAYGLRGPRPYGPKASGVRRLLMLGDSFTFGNGVNDHETFSALIQQWVDEEHKRIGVINGGIGSHSPLLQYLTLQHIHLPLEPDAVVLWFDIGDVHNDFKYHRSAIYDESGQLVACNAAYINGRFSVFRYMAQRSTLIAYLYSKFSITARKIRLLGWREYVRIKREGGNVKYLAVHAIGQRRSGTAMLEYDPYLMVREQATTEEFERYWQLTGSMILRIRDLLRERRIPFVLALYPHGQQVGPDQWDRGREAYFFDRGVTYDNPRPFEFIESFARAHDIPVINTYASFRAARDQQLFYDWDGHFTPEGHRVVAQHLQRDAVFADLLDHLTRHVARQQANEEAS